MHRVLTPLDLGLVTAPDTIHAPERSLRRAKNCRYIPNAPGLLPAEGRFIAGTAVPANINTGAHSAERIVQIFSDDEDTFLHFREDELFRRTVFHTTPDPRDVIYNKAAITTRSVHPTDFGESSISAVVFEGQVFATGGRKSLVFDGERPISAHGLPEQAAIFGSDTNSRITVIGGTGTIGIGHWYWWFTWYEPVSDRESAAIPLSPQSGASGVIGANGYLKKTTQSSTSAVRLRVVKATVDNAVPSISFQTPATHVRIYKGYINNRPSPTHALPDTSDVAFPVGYRIAEITIGTFSTVTVGGVQYYEFVDDLSSTIAEGPVVDTLTSKPVYRSVTVTTDGRRASVSRDSPPPRCSVLGAFEESLVCDDIDDGAVVTRYSQSGLPHSWPGVFEIVHENNPGRIRGYQTLENALGVFMRQGVDRVNYFPRTSEQDFNLGIVKHQLTRDKGLVSRDAIDRFLHPLLGDLIAYVSDDSVYATDLRQIIDLIPHVDFKALVSNPEHCFLVNDPENKRLVFGHQLPSEPRVNHISYLYYDEVRVRGMEQKLAFVGPVERTGGVAALTRMRVSGGKQMVLSTDFRGSFLFESFGDREEGTRTVSDPGVLMSMDALSQEFMPHGVGGEVTAGRLLVYGRGTGSHVATLRGFTNDDIAKTRELAIGVPPNRVLWTKDGTMQVQRAAIQLTGTGPRSFDAVGFVHDPESEEVED